MAKEEDLKRVDLRVTVNCCDGCKRKVLKALSIKGVLKTEIHPSLPKVTVIGNVDVHTLIKKLAKIGKTAEVLAPEETHKPQRDQEKNLDGTQEKPERANDKEIAEEGKVAEKSNPEPDGGSETRKSKHGKSRGNGDGRKKGNCKGVKSDDDCREAPVPEVVMESLHPTILATMPQVSCIVPTNMVQSCGNAVASHARVYYPAEPIAVAVPYYPMSAYSVPPPYGMQGHDFHAHRPPPVQSQDTGFADYFNDDNTVGCHVM